MGSTTTFIHKYCQQSPATGELRYDQSEVVLLHFQDRRLSSRQNAQTRRGWHEKSPRSTSFDAMCHVVKINQKTEQGALVPALAGPFLGPLSVGPYLGSPFASLGFLWPLVFDQPSTCGQIVSFSSGACRSLEFIHLTCMIVECLTAAHRVSCSSVTILCRL